MERCPHCQARCRGDPHCPRCQMELGLLLATERAAARAISAGLALLADDPARAAQQFTRAAAFQRSPLVTHLLAFARSLAALRNARPAQHPVPECD